MGDQLNCIIVEDELMARKSLGTLCSKVDKLQLAESFVSADEALNYLEQNEVDLIFLDIEMPGLSGIEMLDQMAFIPQVIFTTGNKEYAYDAYEYEVTDFLKKPITQPRFLKAIDRAMARKQQLDIVAHTSAQHEIYIRADGKFIRVAYKDILYLENVGDYVKVLTKQGNHIIHGSLKSIDARILHPRFLKVHRSFIVNLEHIVDIQDNSIVIGRKVIPISRAHKPILMKSINIL